MAYHLKTVSSSSHNIANRTATAAASSNVSKLDTSLKQPEQQRKMDGGGGDDDDKNELEFLQQLVSIVKLDDINQISATQRNMLNRFEKTNEMLVNCNALGQLHFLKLSTDFRRRTQLLLGMHKDLDNIFRRIRVLKQKLREKYPDVPIAEVLRSEDDDDDDEVQTDSMPVPKQKSSTNDNETDGGGES